LPVQAHGKGSAQAKAYTGIVSGWSEESGDENIWRRGREAKAKCSIAQHKVFGDNIYI
jgi:hypothetical protein